jgi:spore coat protein JB
MNNNMNQAELKQFITEITFALEDITLFLDTHPKCRDALSYYETYRNMRDQALEEYVNQFGPLNRYQVTNENYFDWIDSPWPWERMCDC